MSYNFSDSDQREAAMAAKWAECCEENTVLRQQLATAQAALQAVSDDWDGEHFHNGGSSFMPAVNKALGRGEQ